MTTLSGHWSCATQRNNKARAAGVVVAGAHNELAIVWPAGSVLAFLPQPQVRPYYHTGAAGSQRMPLGQHCLGTVGAIGILGMGAEALIAHLDQKMTSRHQMSAKLAQMQ